MNNKNTLLSATIAATLAAGAGLVPTMAAGDDLTPVQELT